MKRNLNHDGQILLITLLVLSVATTIALALISRSTTDVNISTQVEESSRAFSAAEAGIEQSLKKSSGVSGALSSGETYTTTQDIIGGTASYEFPKAIAKGDVATLWLVPHDANGNPIVSGGANYTSDTLTLCWGNEGAGAVPAIVAAFHFIDATDSTYKVSRVALNTENDGDNFDMTGIGGGCSTNTDFSKSITLANLGIVRTADRILMVRIRPLYANAWIAASSAVALPQQGNIFTSCGKTGTNVQRCITAYQQYRAPLEIFDYALYSEAGALTP